MAWRVLRLLLVVLCLLLLPLAAMQFTSEVAWTGSDFAVAGALLIAAGLVHEFILRGIADRRIQLAGTAALGLQFLLVWAQLAVGIL